MDQAPWCGRSAGPRRPRPPARPTPGTTGGPGASVPSGRCPRCTSRRRSRGRRRCGRRRRPARCCGWSSRARIWASARYDSTSSGAGDPLGVGHLDRHRAVELVVVGQVDPAEAALAQQPDHPVAADLDWIACGERRRQDRGCRWIDRVGGFFVLVHRGYRGRRWCRVGAVITCGGIAVVLRGSAPVSHSAATDAPGSTIRRFLLRDSIVMAAAGMHHPWPWDVEKRADWRISRPRFGDFCCSTVL